MADAGLRTARLLLRPPGPGDLAAIVAGVNDYAVSKWLTSVPHPYTREDGENFLARIAAGELGRVWAITEGDAFQGIFSICDELGYWLAADSWGRGIATEAGGAVIGHHFADPVADDLLSGHIDGNLVSRRVLTKLGFEETGHDSAFALSRGENVARCMMRLTRARWWESRRAAGDPGDGAALWR